MSCPSSAELSRGLRAGDAREVVDHLRTCVRCRRLRELDRQAAEAVRAEPAFVPDPAQVAAARAGLLAAARAERPARSALAPAWWIGGGLVLAAAAALLWARPGRGPASSPQAAIEPLAGGRVATLSGPPDQTVQVDGAARIQLAALAADQRFRVLADDGEVESRGGVFEVQVVDRSLRSVRVVSGRVEVRASGVEPVGLGPAEEWRVELALAAPPGRAAAVVAPAAPRAPLTPGDPTGAVASGTGDLTGAADPAAAPSAGTAALAQAVGAGSASASPASPRAPRLDPDRPRAAADPTRRTITTPRPGAEEARPGAGGAASAAPAPAPAITVGPPATATVTAPGPARRPHEQAFDRGWAALSAGQAGLAAREFERAATSAAGDPLAEDAWFWRASALARVDRAAAARAFTTFLASYPRSPRAGEAQAVLGWLVLEHDLDRAERLFRAAAADKAASVRTSATKGLAAVAARRGR